MPKINRKYKDRLFGLRFGTEEYKEDILSLYNALNRTNYDNTGDITITTIDDVIYIGMKNDISLLLDGNMSLWEQQSSVNPNMPLRGFLYFGNLYDQYVKKNKLNIYGKKLQKLPTPQYIVFYNGEEEYAAVQNLKLSDSFIHKTMDGGFEWTATVYNLNRGKNEELLAQCRPLYEYMEFVNRIRDNKKNGMMIETAVTAAVDSCIADNIMRAFLTKHKAEVMSVCITEFDEKAYTEGIREEGREEGRREGLNQGLEALVCSLKDFLPDFESVYRAVIRNEAFRNVSKEQVQEYYQK